MCGPSQSVAPSASPHYFGVVGGNSAASAPTPAPAAPQAPVFSPSVSAAAPVAAQGSPPTAAKPVAAPVAQGRGGVGAVFAPAGSPGRVVM